jgi:hypothetical protein
LMRGSRRRILVISPKRTLTYRILSWVWGSRCFAGVSPGVWRRESLPTGKLCRHFATTPLRNVDANLFVFHLFQ